MNQPLPLRSIAILGAVFVVVLVAPCFAQKEAEGAVLRVSASSGPTATSMSESQPFNSGVTILTPTDGVDFSGYLRRTVATLRKHWIAEIGKVGYDKVREKGVTAVRITILPDGTIQNALLDKASGSANLDDISLRAAKSAGPFEDFPTGYSRPSIEMRIGFYYNLPPPGGNSAPRQTPPHTP